MEIKIALIGDHQPEITAHIAIPRALNLASSVLGIEVIFNWLDSVHLKPQDLKPYHGVWGVPYSPYINMENILAAIEFARTQSIPYLGTCAGYQHAVLEFARNQLGLTDAENTEVNQDTNCPLISSLSCSLVEVSDRIKLQDGSAIATIYNATNIEEGYHCSYGVNSEYLSLFAGSDMIFTGFDKEHDPRVFELINHPFFIGTAFQPERSTLKWNNHPLITEFVKAATASAI